MNLLNMDFFSSLDVRDSTQAFDNAISLGMTDCNDWMYMYSSGNFDCFKHWLSRGYVCYRYKGFWWQLCKFFHLRLFCKF